MVNKDFFDRDYYECGISTGKSMYENYRWIPQISFERACALRALYPNARSILDFGCAKGYIVYVLRLLGVVAYGYDISEYACRNCRCEVAKYITHEKVFIPEVELVYGKDVLEHVPYGLLDDELGFIRRRCNSAFFIVPFGDNGKYRIPEYHEDKSHIIIEDEEWWANKFIANGFLIRNMSYNVLGFKDRWIAISKYGNGFFFLERGL